MATVNKSVQLIEGANGAFHFEDIYPSIDGGRFPVKRIVGERVELWADCYRGGHDVTAVSLFWRHKGEGEWHRAPMSRHSNGHWFGAFIPEQAGCYGYAWTCGFATWRRAFARKRQAGADVAVDTVEGACMLTKAQAGGPARTPVILKQCEMFLQTKDTATLLMDDLNEAMAEGQFGPDLTRSQPCPLVVDRVGTRVGAWYEIVPRENAALQQTFDLRFIPINDGNVIRFVKQSAHQTHTVAVAIAISRDVLEFWLPLGDTPVVVNGSRAAAVESLVTGEQSASTGAASSCGLSRTAMPPCSSALWREVAP